VYRSKTQKKPQQKRVAVPVTCLETRAVHLEMAWGLDNDMFLKAFTRTSHHGVPKEVISNRGTNFIDVVGELKKQVSQLDRQKLESNSNMEIQPTSCFTF